MGLGVTDLPENLYRAVIEDRHTDEPRLGVADWLDERNDPWGEYIRLEIQYRAMIRSGQRPPHGLSERSRELRKNAGQWTGPVRQYENVRGHAGAPCGGFKEQLVLTAAHFLEHADDIMSLAPIRHLDLHDSKDSIARLVQCPHLGDIVSLSLQRAGLDDEDVRLLASCRHLTRLRYFNLWSNRITDRGIEMLVISPYLRDLEVGLFDYNLARPVEQEEGVDSVTGALMRDYLWPTPFAEELEAKHGHRRWFRFRENCPFDEGPSRFDF